MSALYGDKVQRNEASGPCDVVGELTTSMAGNVVLRTGRLRLTGWEQTGHIVLTPNEAMALGVELETLGGRAADDADAWARACGDA